MSMDRPTGVTTEAWVVIEARRREAAANRGDRFLVNLDDVMLVGEQEDEDIIGGENAGDTG